MGKIASKKKKKRKKIENISYYQTIATEQLVIEFTRKTVGM